MENLKKSDVGKAVERHVKALARGKKGYHSADLLMDQLEKELEPHQIILTPSGKRYEFVDKMEGKTKHNVGQNFRRYEFKEVEAP